MVHSSEYDIMHAQCAWYLATLQDQSRELHDLCVFEEPFTLIQFV